MADMTIAEFCDLHGACEAGRDWALAECETMADVWAAARPDWWVWVATRPGVLDDRTLRLFAVHCARQVEHLLTDDRSRRAIDVAERFANGAATQEELAAASDAARAAAWAASAASAAARAAAWAAWAASAASAASAARAAASDAAWAASDAAWAASDAAWAASADQVGWARKNTKPNFERS